MFSLHARTVRCLYIYITNAPPYQSSVHAPTSGPLHFSHSADHFYDFCPLPDPDVGLSIFVCDVEHTSFHFGLCGRKFVLCLFGECPCLCTIRHSWQHTVCTKFKCALPQRTRGERMRLILQRLQYYNEPSSIISLSSGTYRVRTGNQYSRNLELVHLTGSDRILFRVDGSQRGFT